MWCEVVFLLPLFLQLFLFIFFFGRIQLLFQGARTLPASTSAVLFAQRGVRRELSWNNEVNLVARAITRL